MTDELPPPLVPRSVILRDFPYMPLDVVRLRDSTLVTRAAPEAFRCAVLLWCVSWHQVPAGSLPDDDQELASFAGFGKVVREWRKHRAGALHGWIKCSDGRLYHPVVAEKAIEALQARHLQAYRTECARIKKHAQRTKTDADYPTFEQWVNHFESTGSTRWTASVEPFSAPASPDPVPGTESPRPGMSRSKGREGKGREGISITGTPNSAAHCENPERAQGIACALRGYGYQVNSDSLEVTQLVGMRATDGEIAEACTKAKGYGILRPKPLAWVVSRIGGRRDDATTGGRAQAPAPVPVDPAVAARRAVDARLEDDLIEARQLADIGHIDAAQRAEREAKARSTHASAIAALGAAA